MSGLPGTSGNSIWVTSVSGNQLTLSWPSDHLGWIVQSKNIDDYKGIDVKGKIMVVLAQAPPVTQGEARGAQPNTILSPATYAQQHGAKADCGGNRDARQVAGRERRCLVIHRVFSTSHITHS